VPISQVEEHNISPLFSVFENNRYTLYSAVVSLLWILRENLMFYFLENVG
jgi:hypothetical protein